jgi:hypothetical protein
MIWKDMERRTVYRGFRCDMVKHYIPSEGVCYLARIFRRDKIVFRTRTSIYGCDSFAKFENEYVFPKIDSMLEKLAQERKTRNNARRAVREKNRKLAILFAE